MKTVKTDALRRWAKTFWDLMRVRNGLLAFLGILVSAVLVSNGNFGVVFSGNVLLAGIAAFLITSAGNILNDYFDVEIDKINKPERPIPSNKITRSDALMLSLALFLVGNALSKYINFYCLIIAAINTMVLIIYSKYSKKLLLISNLGISYLVASVFPFGALAVGIDPFQLREIRIPVIITICAFLMTFSREIIKDIEDIEGDRRMYSVSIPIRFGIKRSRNIAVIFALTAIILSTIPFITHPVFFNLINYGLLIFIADLIFIVSLILDPSIGQRLMIAGMFIALLAFFFANFQFLI